MGMDAGTPPGLWERIRRLVQDEMAKFARSGFLRNASISEGGLTIKGGFFRLLAKVTGGVELVYFGPIGGVLGNGERQQVMWVRRADNSTALRLWDAFPGEDGTLNQALSWQDRSGNVVFADDTDSGQGIARPYVPGVFYLVRDGDWPVTTSSGFEALYRAKMPKQQPRLRVAAWAGNSAPGTTGEVRVMVNGVQLGSTVSISDDFVAEYVFGTAAVAGSHLSELVIELEARRVSGTGGIKACPSRMEGRQS